MLQQKNKFRVSSGRGELYVSRGSKNKRKKIIMRIIILLIVIALAALTVFGITKAIKLCSDMVKGDFAFSHVTPEDWPEHGELSSIKKDYALSVQYPVVNKETDKAIKQDAEKLFEGLKEEIKQFERGKKENRAVYTANYSVIKNSDTYISLLYTIHRVNPMREIDDVQYFSKVYDTAEGKAVSAEDIFNEKYVHTVAQYVTSTLEDNPDYSEDVLTELFAANTNPEMENYSNIGFNDDVMTLYYGAGKIFPTDVGAITVDVPLSRIHNTMNINITGYTPPLFDPELPMIALTFDDGPLTENTSRILDVLEANNSRATFFIIGDRVPGQADMITRGVSLGCEYGNHTWGHANLAKASVEEIASQINQTDDALNSVIGKPTTLARAPYAEITDTVFQTVDKPFIGWTIDTEDWKTRDAEAVKAEILDNVKDGDIILMHDLYESTAAAVEAVVPELINRGFQLVTVSEMMGARGVELTSGKLYRRAPNKQ